MHLSTNSGTKHEVIRCLLNNIDPDVRLVHLPLFSMKKYTEIRSQIKSGDVFMIEGRGIVSRLIRALTAQKYKPCGDVGMD